MSASGRNKISVAKNSKSLVLLVRGSYSMHQKTPLLIEFMGKGQKLAGYVEQGAATI